jgi:hypothetical protein
MNTPTPKLACRGVSQPHRMVLLAQGSGLPVERHTCILSQDAADVQSCNTTAEQLRDAWPSPCAVTWSDLSWPDMRRSIASHRDSSGAQVPALLDLSCDAVSACTRGAAGHLRQASLAVSRR